MSVEHSDYIGSWRLTRNPRLGTDSGVIFTAVIHSAAGHVSTLLDVGCGRGYPADDTNPEPNIFDFRSPTRTVIGIDVDAAGEVNPLIDEFRLIGADGRWPVDDFSCDLVMSDWTLEHIDRPDDFVAELNRVLRPGGLFVGRSINARSLLATVSRTVPNGSHANVLRRFQPGRKAVDVFPVRYQMNTAAALNRLFGERFESTTAYLPGIASYFPKWPRFSNAVHWIESRFPDRFRTVILVAARKRA